MTMVVMMLLLVDADAWLSGDSALIAGLIKEVCRCVRAGASPSNAQFSPAAEGNFLDRRAFQWLRMVASVCGVGSDGFKQVGFSRHASFSGTHEFN